MPSDVLTMGNQTQRRRGLTLLEVMLAMSLFAIVIASVYGTLQSGVDAFRTGTDSMQLYQDARVALARFGEDLTSSLHLLSLPFPEPEVALDDEGNPIEDDRFDEEDTLQIIFRGTADSVTFMISMYTPDDEAFPIDIREISYAVKEGQLIKEITRSLFKRRMAEILRQRACGDESSFRADAYAGGGWLDEIPPIVIASRVSSLELEYYDGDIWQNVWDSEEFIYVDAPDWEEWPDEEKPRRGLPRMVKAVLTLENGDILSTLFRIPAADLNEIQQLRGDEEGKNLVANTRIGQTAGGGRKLWNCGGSNQPQGQEGDRSSLRERREQREPRERRSR